MKKVAAYIMLFASLLLPMQQASADISSAFSGLLAGANGNVNSPGYFNSQTRHVFSGGGLNIHFPTQEVQVISVTPPSISAGCNGISFQFGGFSFISGAQLSQFVQQASQAALGYVIFLAIKTLCPQCEAVLSAIQHMAQLAAKSAMDSCAVGKAIGTAIAGQLFPQPQTDSTSAKTACATYGTDQGQSSSYMAAISDGVCSLAGDVDGAVSWISKNFNSLTKQEQAAHSDLQGNTTWLALQSLGYTDVADMEFIMSITGTTINKPTTGTASSSTTKATDAASVPTPGSSYYAPRILDAKEAGHLLLCGENGTQSNDPVAQQICSGLYKTQASVPQLFECEDTDECLSFVDSGSSNTMSIIGTEGFIAYVHGILSLGLKEIQAGTPIDGTVVQLANQAPFPLYQMLNIAAVYPSQATDLINNSTYLISVLMAQAMFNRIIAQSAKQNISGDASGAKNNAALAEKMHALLDELTVANQGETDHLAKWFALQEGLMAQIKDANQAIQTSVMSAGLSGNHWFSTGVMAGTTKAVAP